MAIETMALNFITLLIQLSACWLWYRLGKSIRTKQLKQLESQVAALTKKNAELEDIKKINFKTIELMFENCSQLSKKLKPPTVSELHTKVYSTLS